VGIKLGLNVILKKIAKSVAKFKKKYEEVSWTYWKIDILTEIMIGNGWIKRVGSLLVGT